MLFVCVRFYVLQATGDYGWGSCTPEVLERFKKKKEVDGTWEGRLKLSRVPNIGECLNIDNVKDLPDWVKNVFRKRDVLGVEHVHDPNLDREDAAIVTLRTYADTNAFEFVDELMKRADFTRINE